MLQGIRKRKEIERISSRPIGPGFDSQLDITFFIFPNVQMYLWLPMQGDLLVILEYVSCLKQGVT